MRERTRSIAIWLGVLLVAVVVTWLRIRLIDGLHDQGWFVKYYELAGRALAGRIPVERLGDVSPAYFWTMLALRSIGLDVHAIRDVQIAGVTVAALLCALAAWRLGGWVAAIATAVLILGNRGALVMASELEPEILILVLNSAAIFALVHGAAAVQSAEGRAQSAEDPHPDADARPSSALCALPSALCFAIAGFLLGLSATARPVALGAIILVGIWILVRVRRAAIPFFASALIPIAVVLAVNSSLTGSMSIMQPGSQFYEGNNPLATGASGVLPRIVLDFEHSSDEPDFLHVAYRRVASRATGQSEDARAANQYWSGKAIAFFRHFPSRALEIFGWKALLSIHNYDIFDLVTTQRKAVELSRYPAISFGAIFALAVVAFVVHRGRATLILIALTAVATVAALLLFNVTARQRTALLAPLSVLAGTGCAGIVRLARAKSEGALLAFGFVAVVTPLLGIEGPPMSENDYSWWSSFRAAELRGTARRLRAAGREGEAIQAAASATILDPSRPALVSPEVLRSHALSLAERVEAAEQKFDIAVALQRAGAWAESEAFLTTLSDYEPRRENRAVSSVAYYRAVAAIHRGTAPDEVRTLLDRALREAPGDPHVLALRSRFGDRRALPALDAIHDPFTRDYAMAVAYADTGQPARAVALLDGVIRKMPEWRRPAVLRHALRSAISRSGSSRPGQAGQ